MTAPNSVSRSKLGRLGSLVFSATLAMFVVGLVATPAYATVTCVHTVATSTLAIGLEAGDAASVSIGAASAIVVKDGTGATIACTGSPTTANTTTVNVTVTGGASDQTFTIDQTGVGGAFASAIDFSVDLGSSAGDSFVITGTSSVDNIRFGVSGASLDANDTTDVTFSNVETFTVNGGSGNDVVTGAGGAGGAGNIGAAADYGLTLNGGANDDSLTGGAAADTLNGGSENDTLAGGANPAAGDTADYAGAVSAVTVNLALATAQNTGGAGTDTLATIENLTGSAFNDVLTGNTSANVLDGAAGDDTLQGGAGGDILTGGANGAGGDTASYAASSAGVTVTVNGAASGGDAAGDSLATIENLTGSASNDSLTGDASANVLQGLAGNDTLTGAVGTDTASYSAATAAVTVNLSTATAQNTGGAGTDTLATIENLTGGSGNDTLTGEAGTNTLDGGAGDDTLAGLAGTDTLTGGANGAGGDTATYAAAPSAVSVNLSVTVAQNTLGAGTDTLGTVENLIGSAFDDTLTGDNNANKLTGGNGVDSTSYVGAASGVTVNLASGAVTGGGGADTLATIENVTGSNFNDSLIGDGNANVLNGGDGNDVVNGGGGNDTETGGSGTDTAKFAGASGGVTASLATGTSSGGAGNDTLLTFENLTGSKSADKLTGDSNANVIKGAGGNDVLRGGDGNDTLNGGKGADTVVYSGAGAAVNVNLGNGTASGQGSDSLSQIENATGTSFGDRLTGSAAANVLKGRGGADTLKGLAGNDRLLGGPGHDTGNGGPGSDICKSIEVPTSC